MQVGSASEGLHLVRVAAFVIGVAGVQRLVHVCHEVHDVLECLELVRIGG
jgi:hypothetical protein